MARRMERTRLIYCTCRRPRAILNTSLWILVEEVAPFHYSHVHVLSNDFLKYPACVVCISGVWNIDHNSRLAWKFTACQLIKAEISSYYPTIRLRQQNVACRTFSRSASRKSCWKPKLQMNVDRPSVCIRTTWPPFENNPLFGYASVQLAATITDRPMPVNLEAARTTNSRRSLPRCQRRYSKRIPVAKADQLLVVTLRVTIRRRFRAAQGQLLLPAAIWTTSRDVHIQHRRIYVYEFLRFGCASAKAESLSSARSVDSGRFWRQRLRLLESFACKSWTKELYNSLKSSGAFVRGKQILYRCLNFDATRSMIFLLYLPLR